MDSKLEAQINSLWAKRGIEQCVEELEGKSPFYEARTSIGQIVIGDKIAQVVVSVNTDTEDFLDDFVVERFESK